MSFDIALSGIQAIDQQLDQISNNIANSGTYGFKSSRDNFSALYADAGRPNGTAIGSVSQSMDVTGGLVNTGDNLNAAINGAGFFVVKNAQGETNYTRVGIFGTDTSGYVTTTTGERVQGNVITPPSTVAGPVGDIKVSTGQIPAVASTNLNFVANLSADWTVNANAFTGPTAADPATGTLAVPAANYNDSRTSTIYDSLGTVHTLTQYFVATGPGAVTVNYAVDGTDTGQTQSLTFNPQGQLTSPLAGAATPLTLSGLSDGAADMSVNFDYTGSTEFAGNTTVATNQADGYASGGYTGIQIGADGSIIANYSNNQQQVVGKLAVATFANVDGLQPIDNTSWAATTASGTANVGNPGVGQAGSLTVGSLEESNVDITSELVGLMTSQRNYQANSKVIQTEDTMLQSLMQALQ